MASRSVSSGPVHEGRAWSSDSRRSSRAEVSSIGPHPRATRTEPVLVHPYRLARDQMHHPTHRPGRMTPMATGSGHSTLTIGRAQVLAYRVVAQGLDRPGAGPDGLAPT